MPRKLRLLFLCTGNSARSIIAEGLLRHMASERFEVESAGTQPRGAVQPMALRVLHDLYGYDATPFARSQSVDEFRHQDFDFVITVCDEARESCPVWPARTVHAHWGMEDPSRVEGDEETRFHAYRETAIELRRRLDLFCAIPFEKLDRMARAEKARAIVAPAG
jgi:arsenate reductase